MTTHGPEIKYRCFNDCVQTGCPGHTVKVKYHHTSDVMFFVDEKGREESEDPDRWRAKMRAWEAYEAEH